MSRDVYIHRLLDDKDIYAPFVGHLGYICTHFFNREYICFKITKGEGIFALFFTKVT